MKNQLKEKLNLDEKTREVIYCILVVVVIVFVAFGDRIVLRFIKANPNPNDRVFGGETKEPYSIPFLEQLTLDEVLDKIHNRKSFLLLSSKDNCYTCEMYLPLLEEELEKINTPMYYIDRDLYNENSEALDEFIHLDENISQNFMYTPYLMYFKEGTFKAELVGKKDQDLLEQFFINNEI